MTASSKPRIILADDHTFIADACAQILRNEFEIVASVKDGQALLEVAPRLKPDVIVLDIGMPLLNGIEAGKRIKKLLRGARLVYLTMNPDLGVAEEAFRNGASGYLLKTSAATELPVAIREVLKGKKYVSPALTNDPESFFLDIRVSQPKKEELTNRQIEVLQLLAEGRSMKEAAYTLKLTPRTIAFHKYQIMERLRLKTNAELVEYALRKHVITPHS